MPKHRIVIIGGSFGGVNTAYRLRRELGEGAKITVISAEPHFTFIPSLPWVTMGWREPDRLRVPLGPALARRHVDVIADTAVEIDPTAGSVRTRKGSEVPYDRLMLATAWGMVKQVWTAPSAGSLPGTLVQSRSAPVASIRRS